MLHIRPEIDSSLRGGRPVVALESTLIAHGLPWPTNFETACAAEAEIRACGAIPATIAILLGQPVVGLNHDEIESLARDSIALKASRRDLAVAIAQNKSAATTVAATMALAHRAGIRVLATGGIGGVHRDNSDISADLIELARTPVAVVCSGAKSILDLHRTLEMLETLSVPVLGFRTDTFSAFFLVSSPIPVPVRCETPGAISEILRTHWQLGGAGVVIAQPVPANVALDLMQWAPALAEAERLADEKCIRGNAVTPFLLSRLAEITQGATLRANQALILANARLAAEVAKTL